MLRVILENIYFHVCGVVGVDVRMSILGNIRVCFIARIILNVARVGKNMRAKRSLVGVCFRAPKGCVLSVISVGIRHVERVTCDRMLRVHIVSQKRKNVRAPIVTILWHS
jgi:hypothetical protein